MAKFDLVHYDTVAKRQQAEPTHSAEVDTRADDLTVSPDGSTIVLSTSSGRYGSAVYWRLDSAGEWALVEDNLHVWGGWSRNGWLIYATDGRDLRPLDVNRSVWGSDIKLLDQRTGQTRTLVSGTSMNQGPSWCADARGER